MAQDGADAGQGRALAEHGGGGGVSENVSAVDRSLDPGPAQCGTHDMCHGGTGQRPDRSHAPW